MDRKEVIKILRANNYNCAQAIAVAFSNVLGCDPIHTFKMAEALGSGLGDREDACGALTGAALMVGMKKSDGNIECPESRDQTYRTMIMLKKEFKDKMGSTICKDIRNKETHCEECLLLTCELLDKYLLGIYPDNEKPEFKVIRNENAKF